MQKNENLVQVSFTDYQKLLTIHQKFMDEIKKVAGTQLPTSSLTQEDGVLQATYLDLKLSASRRTVVLNSQFFANEYAFKGTLSNKQEHVLLSLYLKPFGEMYSDSACTTKFCDFNNTYIVKNILKKIQEAALESQFFKPVQESIATS